MHKTATAVLFGLAFGTLTGCGGGGSGSAGPDLVEISSSNAKTITGAVLSSALDGGELSAFAPTDAGMAAAKPDSRLYAKIGSIESDQTSSLMKQSQAGYMQQAQIASVTTDCDVAGTVTVSANIASETTLTAGDSITLTYADCDDGTTRVDGEFAMEVTSFSGDFASGLFSLGIDVTLTSFQVAAAGETFSADGDISFLTDTTASPTISTTVSADSLTVSGSGETNTLLDYVLMQMSDAVTGEYSRATSGTLTSSAFDGSVTFTTQVELTGTGDGNALSGEVLITGAGGASIHVVVLDGTGVRLNVDVDGDGEIDEIVDATWEELT